MTLAPPPTTSTGIRQAKALTRAVAMDLRRHSTPTWCLDFRAML